MCPNNPPLSTCGIYSLCYSCLGPAPPRSVGTCLRYMVRHTRN